MDFLFTINVRFNNGFVGVGNLIVLFYIFDVGVVVENIVDGEVFVLLQERYKGNDREAGLLEIPAGKIREFENIYDCLRREIFEETGLILCMFRL